MQLSPQRREALLKFQSFHFYGPTLPTGVSASMKPRMAEVGLLRCEIKRSGGPKWYGLSVLGEKVRDRLAQAIEARRAETGTGSVHESGDE